MKYTAAFAAAALVAGAVAQAPPPFSGSSSTMTGTMSMPTGSMPPPSGTMSMPTGSMPPPSGSMPPPSGSMPPPFKSGTMGPPSGSMSMPPPSKSADLNAWGAWATSSTTKPCDYYETKVVSAITTYCPSPTTIVHGVKTYTVESACTLTITDCPCTISIPVWTSTSTSCKETATTTPCDTAVVAAVTAATSATSSPCSTSPYVAKYTGAANALVANVGAGLAAVGALAAIAL